jgi:hypothetical protein
MKEELTLVPDVSKMRRVMYGEKGRSIGGTSDLLR